MTSSFSERLKDLRLERGLSQAQLAKELNGAITQAAIGFWETERRVPTLNSVIILAQYFGVTLDYIAGLED